MVSARTSSGSATTAVGGLPGVQVGQNQRDGLRMLDFEKLRQLLRIGFLQAFQVDRILVHRVRNLVEQALGAGLAEGFDSSFCANSGPPSAR
jgi:hypothetical protein